MDGLRKASPLTRFVATSGVLRDQPFVLVDIGCSGGIATGWRGFEPDLVAYGVDPIPQECERLRSRETNPKVSYHNYFLALPEDHPFVIDRRGIGPWSNNPWSRLSAAWAVEIERQRNPRPHLDELVGTNRWSDAVDFSGIETLTFGGFLERHACRNLDFVKIDVDGKDLEILVSMQEALASHNILGVAIEVNFHGTDRATDHSFHNVDRLMRSCGFDLFHLTSRLYSNRALPAPFIDFPGKSVFGRPCQGDAVYIRDLAAPHNLDYALGLSAAKVLKAACLFDLIGLPDCSAEILSTFRGRLAELLDVNAALDLLVPRVRGRKLSYADYMAAFETDPEQCMSTTSRCKRLLYRWLQVADDGAAGPGSWRKRLGRWLWGCLVRIRGD